MQVTNYVPMQTTSPFEATDGFEAEGANPFAAAAEEPEVTEDEIDEPKKVAKKSTPAKAKDPELDAIVDDWDD